MKRETGYIYFIGDAEEGPIKIGFSRRPKKRLYTVQTHYPGRVRILAKFSGTHAAEKALHRRFSAHRIHGEWFTRGPDILEFIEQLKLKRDASVEIDDTPVRRRNSWDVIQDRERAEYHRRTGQMMPDYTIINPDAIEQQRRSVHKLYTSKSPRLLQVGMYDAYDAQRGALIHKSTQIPWTDLHKIYTGRKEKQNQILVDRTTMLQK